MSDFRAQIERISSGQSSDEGRSSVLVAKGKPVNFVQFSSMGGRIGPPGRGPYSGCEWGVEGFSEVLSREVAPLGNQGHHR